MSRPLSGGDIKKMFSYLHTLIVQECKGETGTFFLWPNIDTTRCCMLRRAKNNPTSSFVSRMVNMK